jgi:ABC-type antimicrobial peptide transport system permease subunit
VIKVLGASIANISIIINKQLIIVLFVSCLLGAWGGYALSDILMDSIWDYYQKATVATMIISSLILLLASGLTVAFKTYSTARMNPVNVLRDE